VLEIGPLTIHFYALSILTGIAVAIWIGRRRYKAIGGNPEDISEAALWAVPAGIIGGRIYHVITSPQKYFGEGGNPIDALKIWQGGLGIWGAISLGAVGAYLYYRTHQTSHSFSYFLDALAPGVALAQAIGRIGNWFNIELFGSPTTLPWGLEVPAFKRPAEFSEFATFHPTFLYELIWCTALALFLMKLPKFISTRFSNPGDLFAIYVLGYTVGRLWIEALRVDTATLILGLRFNIWISLLVLVSAMTYLYKSSRNLKKNPTN
jgi:prolipoprotein diacylglyceryl transferase